MGLILTPVGETGAEQIRLTATTSLTVSSEPGFTNATANVDLNGEAAGIDIGFSSRQIHYALTIAPGTATGYIDGKRLLTNQIPSIDPSLLYNITIFISGGAQDSQDVNLEPQYPGDSVSGGSVQVAEASRHSFSGIRFTPGRALYTGQSFSPPDGIISLA
jgi:hypothetical protein